VSEVADPRPAVDPPDQDRAAPATRHERARHGLVGPFSGKQLGVGFALVLVVAVALIVVTTPLGQTGATGVADPRPTAYIIDTPPAEGLKPGDLAPALVAQRADGTPYELRDLDGQPVRLEDLRGRGVWIDFWASWCPPCQAEMPVLRSLADQYRDQGLTVIAVSVQETSEQDVRDYAERYGLTYTVAADLEGLIFHRYKVYALPTQFFIGPDGVIRQVVQGPVDETSGAELVRSILPASGG
jgi:peroxiredoxin